MSRAVKIALLLLVAVVVVVIIGVAWYFFIRDDSEPPLELTPTTTGADGSADPSTTGGDPAGGESPDGDWIVSRESAAGDAVSVVGYRVTEKLARLPARSDAVGRTELVAGTLTVEGTSITAVEVTADLTGLESDVDRRDESLTSKGLETDTFPEANFTLTEPIELGEVPATGEDVSVTAVGDLTLHGVTRSVEVAIDARWSADESGEEIEVVGSTPIVMADYDIEPPSVGGIVDVDDNGTMEFQLFFTRA